MAFEAVGKLYKKFPTESKSATFQAREFVIEVMEGNYPQLIKFQLLQERCPLLDTYNEGEEVKVHFDLRGREWQGKYLTTLNCWRLEHSGAVSDAAPVVKTATQSVEHVVKKATPPPPSMEDSFPSLKDAPLKVMGDDDLPF